MAFKCIRTESIDESYWISVWPLWASEQNSWTSRIGFLYGFLGFRTEFIDESYWVSVWPFRASEQNSWTSRTGFLYGLSELPNRIHGRVVHTSRTGFLYGL